MSAQFIKVVTVEEMVRVEKWAIAHGASEEAFMHEAGRGVAEVVAQNYPGKRVVIVAGKGNKGGDGFVAGIELLKRGFRVRAVCVGDEGTKLNLSFRKRFVEAGGVVGTQIDFTHDEVVIDALLGTGFHGSVEKPFSTFIDAINHSSKPVVSIDIPSGLNGTTGLASHAVKATHTVTLGFPKIGLFLQDGWNHTGILHIQSFGLSLQAENQARAIAQIPVLATLALPPMLRTQHKYQRGFVAGFGGSAAMPGAPQLSGLGALHVGAGIVKLFSLEPIALTAPELIAQVFDEKLWSEALSKAQAVFIGPGLGRALGVKQWLEKHLSSIKQPCVLDADALYFLSEISQWPKHCVLTPHRGEMARLLGVDKPANDALFLDKCQKFVDEKQVVLILKGAPTFVLAPNSLPIVVPRGDPGLATAGSGDVLTGVCAALLAQGMSLLDAAVLGVVLHALAGEAAAKAKTSYGYSASDLIGFLGEALQFFAGD